MPEQKKVMQERYPALPEWVEALPYVMPVVAQRTTEAEAAMVSVKSALRSRGFGFRWDRVQGVCIAHEGGLGPDPC